MRIKKLLLLPLLALCLTSCIFPQDGDKTPLGWCLWEISKHQGYDNYAYTCQEIKTYNLEENHKYEYALEKCYIIITYSYPLKTEWFCEIEYKNVSKRYLNEKEVYYIDCDVLYEVNYE